MSTKARCVLSISGSWQTPMPTSAPRPGTRRTRLPKRRDRSPTTRAARPRRARRRSGSRSCFLLELEELLDEAVAHPFVDGVHVSVHVSVAGGHDPALGDLR